MTAIIRSGSRKIARAGHCPHGLIDVGIMSPMPRRPFRVVPPVLLAGLLVPASIRPAMSQAPDAAIQQQRPDFRVNIDLVTLDVIPRAADGQFLSDLDKADFEVFEDGQRQDIASVVLVHGGRVFNLLQAPAPVAAVPEGIILPTARRVDDTAGRIFVLLVDDLHFEATMTPHVRALLKKIASTLIHPGDMFAIFSTGPSSIEIPVTYDRARLDYTISKVSGYGMTYRDILDSGEGAQGPQGLRYRAHVAFSTAYKLIGELEHVRDRRKAVILISTGYDFDPFPKGRTGTDQVFGGRYGTPMVDEERADKFLALGQQHNRFADSDLALELRALTGAANRANATVYTIDPRGLVGTVDLGHQVDPTEMRAYISKTQNSLRVLADETGGIAVVNDNDFGGALKRIDAETSDYYVLGYYPSNLDAQHRARAVEVKVGRAGVRVWSRTWYRTREQRQAPSSPQR